MTRSLEAATTLRLKGKWKLMFSELRDTGHCPQPDIQWTVKGNKVTKEIKQARGEKKEMLGLSCSPHLQFLVSASH